jgi:hypothetical protein
MPTVTYSESSFELHEADEWYPATIASIQDGEDYGYGPTVRFVLHIDGEIDAISEEPRETWAMCSAKLTPRSKLYGWVKAIDADIIPSEGGTLDLSVLEDRDIDVMFEHAESENGTRDRVMRGRKDSKTLREMQALASAAAKAKPKAKPAPAVDEDDDVF